MPARTTHISLFSLDETRVELRLSTPPVIFDGDRVRVAGSEKNGVFSALACRNLTTGWLSPVANIGCVFAVMVAFVIFSLMIGLMMSVIFAIVGGGILSIGTPIGLIIPGLATWGLVAMKRKADRLKLARELLG